MKNTAVGIAVIAALIATPARAAPRPAQPQWSWTGFYVGLDAGGAWGRSNIGYVPPGFPFTTAVAGYSAIGSGAPSVGGFTGGAQGGYNWQTGPVVLGVEGDFGALDLRSSFTQTGTPPGNTLMMTAAASTQTDWLATARARFGFTPFDRLLLYATGGVAWTNLRYSEANTYPGLGTATFNSSSARGAGTFGGGFEYGFAPHWSVKAEYLYANFGVSGSSPLTGLFPGITGLHSYSANLQLNIARAGVNYHF